jgi:TusA-related sulfurtransferase
MQLDLTNLACPMPIIKLKKFLAEQVGQTVSVEVLLTDKGGLKDIPAFCKQKGLNCQLLKNEPVIVFRVESIKS